MANETSKTVLRRLSASGFVGRYLVGHGIDGLTMRNHFASPVNGSDRSHAETVLIQLLDATFRYRLQRFDQTLTAIGECAIEFVIRKRNPEETRRGGRLPAG